MHRFGAFLLLAAAAAAQVPAQPKPLRLGNVTFQGSLRTRVEAWDWFEGAGNNAYAFSGNILRFSFSRQQKLFDWQVEFAAPLLFGLPDDAIAPARAEALGHKTRRRARPLLPGASEWMSLRAGYTLVPTQASILSRRPIQYTGWSSY